MTDIYQPTTNHLQTNYQPTINKPTIILFYLFFLSQPWSHGAMEIRLRLTSIIHQAQFTNHLQSRLFQLAPQLFDRLRTVEALELQRGITIDGRWLVNVNYGCMINIDELNSSMVDDMAVNICQLFGTDGANVTSTSRGSRVDGRWSAPASELLEAAVSSCFSSWRSPGAPSHGWQRLALKNMAAACGFLKIAAWRML